MRFAFAPNGSTEDPVLLGSEVVVKRAAQNHFGNTNFGGTDHSLSHLLQAGRLPQTPFREVATIKSGTLGQDSGLASSVGAWVGEVWTITETYQDKPVDDDLRELARRRIREWRNRIEESGFIWSPTGNAADERLFQSDERSSQRIMGAMQMANEMEAAGGTFAVQWMDANDVPVTLDRAGMRSFYLTMSAHVHGAFAQAQVKKAQVAAAATRAEVRAVIAGLIVPGDGNSYD